MHSLAMLAGLGFILYVCVVSILVQRRVKKVGEIDRLSLLGRDVQVLEFATEAGKGWPKLAVFDWYRLLALLNIWRVREALTVLTPLVRKTPPQLRHLLHEIIPLAALLGAVLGEEVLSKPVPPEFEALGTTKVTRAVEAIRRGDFAAAASLLESPSVYRARTGPVGGLAQALSAWCALELHGEARFVNRVALFGEGGPDELAQCWPEFVAALERLD